MIEKVATLPTIRLGMRLYLQTMVRKSELQDAIWDEVWRMRMAGHRVASTIKLSTKFSGAT